MIADKLSIMDRLHFQQAFASEPEPAVNNIRAGLTANLAKQRALYLVMDKNEYDVKYQYNYKLESKLPNALLPTLEGLPIASESSKMITLPELESGGSLGSISRLKETFPKVSELKIVVRNFSSDLLIKLTKVVVDFSLQLTALQLLIFSDHCDFDREHCNHFDLGYLLSQLNNSRFPKLRHFTFLFEDLEEEVNGTFEYKEETIYRYDLHLTWLRLLSGETLEECYLRLPALFIHMQLEVLEANKRLQQLGIIAYYIGQRFSRLDGFQNFNQEILITSSLAAKIVHLLFPWGYTPQEIEVLRYGWWRKLNQLEQFTSLRSIHIDLNTDGDYLILVRKLSGLDRLTHLQIFLRYFPVSALSFCRALSRLPPCSPSVTHLKIQVKSIRGLPGRGAQGELVEFSHRIFSHLSIVQHFPNLRQLEVVFPRDYSCSLCVITPADDGRQCMRKAMRPFRALNQLNLSFRQSQ